MSIDSRAAGTSHAVDGKALAIMLVLCASWGVQQVFVKLALPEVPPITQAAIRSVGGTVIVGAWALWREPRIFRLDDTLWPGIAAGLLFAAEFLMLFVGLRWTSASHAALFLYTAPFFVALGGALLLPKERLRTLQWVGLVLSFIGVALALGASMHAPGVSLAGDLLTLAAGAFWGATTVLVKATKLRDAPAIKVLLYQLAVSGACLVVAATVAGERLPSSLSPVAALSIGYQTIWVAGVTFLAWFSLLRKYHSGELASLTFITPLVGVVAGYAWLGDSLGPRFIVAVALVVGGSVLINRPKRG